MLKRILEVDLLKGKSEHLDFADLRAIPLWVLESVKAKCSWFFGVEPR
jgi:hypothetical protein